MALNLAKRAFFGVAWVTIDLVSIQAISLLLFIVMARYLDPKEFGLLAICLVLLSSCRSIFIDNFVVAITRKTNATALEYTTAFWITSGMALLLFILIQVFASAVETTFGSAGSGRVLRVTSVILLVQGVARTQEAWLGRHLMFRILAIRSLAAAIVAGVAGIILAMNGFGIWALVAQQVLTSAIAFVLLWFNCPWRPGIQVSSRSAREIIKFSWSLIGNSISYAFQQNCDTLLIGSTFGPSSAGIYNVAKRLRLALQLGAVTPINAVTMPTLAEAQRERDHLATTFLTANFVISAICCPIFVGAAATSRDLIVLLFGSQWIQAAPVFSWLAVGALCAVLIDYINTALIIRGNPRLCLYLSLTNMTLILVSFLLIASDKPALLALPFVLPYLVVLPLAVILLHRVLDISAWCWLRSLLAPIGAALLMVLMLHVLSTTMTDSSLPSQGRFLVSIGSAALVYCLALILLRPSLVITFPQLIRSSLRS